MDALGSFFTGHPVMAGFIVYILVALVAACAIGPIIGDGFDVEDEDQP